MLPFATVIDYLDDHSGAFTALLTFALIVVTIVYVALNWRMVAEMGKARRQAMLPRLTVAFHQLGPTVMTAAVKNVGPGAALAVDVTMIYEPIGNTEHV